MILKAREDAMKPATLLATAFLALIAIAHLLRVLYRVDVVVGGTAIPIWMSGPAFVVVGALAVAVWREHRKT